MMNDEMLVLHELSDVPQLWNFNFLKEILCICDDKQTAKTYKLHVLLIVYTKLVATLTAVIESMSPGTR